MLQAKLLNQGINNFKFLFLLVVVSFFVKNIYGQKNNKCEKRLLIYVFLEDNDYINVYDSLAFFNEDKCLKIKIDTINNNDIERVKNNKDIIKYNGVFYSKKQLFPLSKFKDLLRFKIIKYTVGTTLNTDVKAVHGEGCCFGYEQKFFIYNYCRGASSDEIRRCTDIEKSVFYIDGVQLFDGLNHLIKINYGWVKFK